MSHGIKTSASLHFCGKSITGTSQSEADQEHISRLCNQLAAKDAEISRLRDLLARQSAKHGQGKSTKTILESMLIDRVSEALKESNDGL